MKSALYSPILILALLCSSFLCSGQESKESVILYNSQPIKVELSEVGKILSFYGLMPGYMDGFQLGESTTIQKELVVDNQSPTFTNESKNAEYDIISEERVTMQFNPGFATLSKSNISELNKIAQRLKSGQSRKVILIAYKTSSDASKLIKNRLDSTISYLKIKGVADNLILTEIQESKSLSNALTINYID